MFGLPITVVLLILTLVIFRKSKFKKLLKIPGPLLPKGMKGDLPDLMKNPRYFSQHMTSTYGNIYRMYTSNFDSLVVISDPKLAQQLYNNQANMSHSWDLGMGHFIVRYIGDSMGFSSGAKWTKIRKAFRTTLSSASANASLSTMSASLDDWENTLLEPLAQTGKEINIYELVGMMPITIMLNNFFGHSFVNIHMKEVKQMAKDADLITKTFMHNQMAATVLYKHFDTKSNRALGRFKQMFSKFLRDYECSYERQNGEGGAFDAVIKYIQNHDDLNKNSTKKEGITFNEALETTIEIIFANLDVLQPSVAWLFSDILVYPQILDKLNLSQSMAMVDKITLETENPNLLNTIQEVARVHPGFPISMPEILNKDVEVGEYVLPKGTNVSIDQYSLNHNSQYWSNPTKFQIQRYQNLDDFMSKWGMFRFGFGSRRCPGQYYANLILANATIRLFSKYKVELIGTDQELNHHEQIPSVSGGGLTMVPDLKVQLKKRNITEYEKNIKPFDIISPIFPPNTSAKDLFAPGVMIGVSILPKSPLLSKSGSAKLVSFLASLPHPSLIFLTDTLNRHNIKAFHKKKTLSDDEAITIAVKDAQIYHDYLFEAIKNLKEKQPDLKENWITLIRWNDIKDNGTKKLQIIARKYYNESSSLKKRIDEIGMEILTIRRPNSKNNETRLPYLVDFILEELPSLMIGLNYKGEQFQTLGYPTKATSNSLFSTLAKMVDDIKVCPEFLSFREEIMIEAGCKTMSKYIYLPIEEY